MECVGPKRVACALESISVLVMSIELSVAIENPKEA